MNDPRGAAQAGGAPLPELEGALLGGAYRVGKLLGRGGMGAVFEGVQEALGRKVAIKVLLDRSLGNAEITRFEREARSAAALGHPNIVQVTDFQHRPPDPPFLVMERLTGESLRSVIEKGGPLPAERAAKIATQTLDALGAAHRAGLVHRDIKPDNLFVTSMAGVGDVVKVLDFGIAKAMGDTQLTTSGAMMGSPAYMSPEQARGDAVDARTDLYGLGVTLYHALTGRLPFDAKSLPEMLVCILQVEPRPLREAAPWLDPRLSAVVDRAMAKDAAARFSSADEMRAALAPIVAGVMVAPVATPVAVPAAATTLPSPRIQPAPSSSGSGSGAGVVALILGALALAFVGGVAIFLFVRNSKGGTSTAAASVSVEPVPVASAAPLVATGTNNAPLATKASTPTHAGSKGAPTPPVAIAATATNAATVAPPSAAHPSGKVRAECNPSDFGPYDSPDGMRAALAAHAAAFAACAPRACFTHDKSRDTGYDFEYYEAVVDASGAVKSVSHPGDFCAALDPCVLPIVRTINFGATKSPGPLKFECGYFE